MCFVRSLHVLVLTSCFCPYFPVARDSYKILKQSSSHVSPTLLLMSLTDQAWFLSLHLSSFVCLVFRHSLTHTPLLSLTQAGNLLNCQIPALFLSSIFLTINKHNCTSSTKQNIPLLYSAVVDTIFRKMVYH